MTYAPLPPNVRTLLRAQRHAHALLRTLAYHVVRTEDVPSSLSVSSAWRQSFLLGAHARASRMIERRFLRFNAIPETVEPQPSPQTEI